MVGRPIATAALEVWEALAVALAAAEEMTLAALDAEDRMELIAELMGAVAVLMALDTEDSMLWLTSLALALASDEIEDAMEPIEEVAEAGIVVATPPIVVVMRSLVEASDAVEEASGTEVVLTVVEGTADVAEPPAEEGQAV